MRGGNYDWYLRVSHKYKITQCAMVGRSLDVNWTLKNPYREEFGYEIAFPEVSRLKNIWVTTTMMEGGAEK